MVLRKKFWEGRFITCPITQIVYFKKAFFCCWAGNKPTLPVTFLLTIGQTVKPEKFKSKVKNGDFLSKSKVSMTLFLIKSKLTIRKSAETKKIVIFLRKISLRKISFMKNPFKFEMAIISSGNNPVQESGDARLKNVSEKRKRPFWRQEILLIDFYSIYYHKEPSFEGLYSFSS